MNESHASGRRFEGRSFETRRNAQGRERHRGGQRRYSTTAPSARIRVADPARLVAFEVLQAVSERDAYANLVLPGRIRHHHLDRRDAAFATELSYGALRAQGTYDAILECCVDKPLDQLDSAIINALRIGVHQLMAMRVPPHAALNQTVGLARSVIGAGPSTLINAVLRRVSLKNLDEWLAELTAGHQDPIKVASVQHAHPEWVVRALRQSLVGHGRDAAEIDELLAANNASPLVNLIALPGLGDLTEVLDAGAQPSELAPDAAVYSGGDIGRFHSIREGTVRVQDVGSQLVTRALIEVELDESSQRERWLDLCAGPGGKAALMAALAQGRNATVLANEPAVHRAELVRQALAPIPQQVWDIRVSDGRTIDSEFADSFDRVLVDAPCTGLGSLRRRPESRWRRQPSDLADLTPLQRQLLAAAIKAVRPGGVVAYVTCSPHLAETQLVVEDIMRKRTDLQLLDAGAALDAVSLTKDLHAGHHKTAQLWPHIHGTDAMFLALIRKN